MGQVQHADRIVWDDVWTKLMPQLHARAGRILHALQLQPAVLPTLEHIDFTTYLQTCLWQDKPEEDSDFACSDDSHGGVEQWCLHESSSFLLCTPGGGRQLDMQHRHSRTQVAAVNRSLKPA